MARGSLASQISPLGASITVSRRMDAMICLLPARDPGPGGSRQTPCEGRINLQPCGAEGGPLTISRLRIATLLAALALLAPAGRAGAAELKVLSTIALGEAWHELQPRFEATGHKLTLVLGTSGGVNKRVADGETGDVIVSTSGGIEGLLAVPGVDVNTDALASVRSEGRRP